MITLVSQGPGHYEAGTEGEDDHVLVLLDPTFETECDEPHPVKMRKDALRASYSNDSYGQQAFDKFLNNAKLFHGGREFSRQTKEGWVTYVSWMCDGGETHYYSMWTVQIAGEWTENVYDTFGEALSAVEEATGQKVKVSRPRKPKVLPLSAPHEDDDERTAELRDELGAVEGALDRYNELMASDNAPFVDQKLHEWHLKRKAEIEALLSPTLA